MVRPWAIMQPNQQQQQQQQEQQAPQQQQQQQQGQENNQSNRGRKTLIPIREHFVSAHNQKGYLAVKHEKCGLIFTRQAITMYNHLTSKCTALTATEKSVFKLKYTSDGYLNNEYKTEMKEGGVSVDTVISNMGNMENQRPDVTFMENSKHERHRVLCNKYGCIRMTEEHQAIAEQCLMNFIIDKNIAPNVFNSPWWDEFITVLRPDFRTPCPSRMMKQLLPARTEQVRKIVHEVEL